MGSPSAESYELVTRAAALARYIRMTSPEREKYHYPAGMELAVTCCCHLVVDDPNFRDSDAQFCLEEARRQQHPDCIVLAELLCEASKTQRKAINHRAWFD